MSSPGPSADADLETLLGQLDLETKVRLISGAGAWTTQAVPEIGLGGIALSDGPIGVRGGSENDWAASAALPCGSAMAATWDEDLLRRVGDALAAEAVRKGVDVLLGPTINLHRSPLAGRNFECFSEDPLLSGRLATAYVRGLQEHGVGACPKHYVANDAETDRMTVDNRVDERTLHELYLAPFEAVVQDADPWMIMAAYNGVNGAPMTENDLLASPLKDSWGYEGVVVSDWGALYNGEPAARAATDLVMPGPDEKWGQALVEAVRAGRVAETDIDAKVRRLMLLAARTGRLEGKGTGPSLGPAASSAADAAALAREAAAAAAVLVSNDGILPLEPENIGRVAILGPGAECSPAGRWIGDRLSAVPGHAVRRTGGRAEGRVEVVSAAGTDLVDGLRPVRVDELAHTDDGDAVTVRWLDAEGEVVAEQGSATTLLVRITGEVPPGAVALDLECGFVADEDGEWQLGVSGFGAHELQLDGTVVLDEQWPSDLENPHAVFSAAPEQAVPMLLRRDQEVTVRLRFTWNSDAAILFAGLAVRPPRLTADQELSRAVELARTSDVAVVVVGTSEAVESEGMDRTSLALPGRQDELVRAVAAANPRTVVVVNAGAPVEMPWRNEVAAVLLVWFPGMEFGTALADVLLGAVEPGGRLPTTWPAAMAEAPILGTTPTDGRLEYAEGLHIGHRAYLADVVQPAYWFGHGLGYTTWEYESIAVAPDPTGGFTATVRLSNSGNRRGKQVVQVYASRPDSAVDRPVRWLAGFAVVRADDGETVDVPVQISERVLRHWDAERHAWSVEPGRLVLSTGPNAGDMQVSATALLPSGESAVVSS